MTYVIFVVIVVYDVAIVLFYICMNTVVPVMNGHPRDQANVSVHCRWPLIRGTDGHDEMSRDIDNVAVHSRWPLTTGVAQGRYYCSPVHRIKQKISYQSDLVQQSVTQMA